MEKRHRYFLPGYLFYLALSFYFKIGETRNPECNDKKNSLQGRNASVHVTVCVNNIDLFVTLSRCHAVTPCSSPQQHTDQLQFWTAAFKLCPLHCFRKRYVVKMAKNEGANVSRCYVPNLRGFWIVKLPFLTLWPASRVKSPSHAEFYRTLPSITMPISEVWFNYCLHVWYIMWKNNLGYETCRIMFIKLTAKVEGLEVFTSVL